MKALEELKREHRSIEQVLLALGGICRRLEDGQAVTAEPMSQVITFLRSFADGCHHEKEEKYLFPLLERCGLPREGGPTGVMLHEHDMGRDLISEMDAARQGHAAGEAGAGRQYASAGRRFIDLLTAHIQKEESVLFPMSARVLDAAAAAELEQAFGQVENGAGTATHARYCELATALAHEWGNS